VQAITISRIAIAMTIVDVLCSFLKLMIFLSSFCMGLGGAAQAVPFQNAGIFRDSSAGLLG
jgi:hypothetical protein